MTLPVVSGGRPSRLQCGERPSDIVRLRGRCVAGAVQLGAFAQEANAEALAGRTAALLAFLEPAEALAACACRASSSDGAVYRVLVGATPDRDAALSLARELEKVLERPTTLLLR